MTIRNLLRLQTINGATKGPEMKNAARKAKEPSEEKRSDAVSDVLKQKVCEGYLKLARGRPKLPDETG